MNVKRSSSFKVCKHDLKLQESKKTKLFLHDFVLLLSGNKSKT